MMPIDTISKDVTIRKIKDNIFLLENKTTHDTDKASVKEDMVNTESYVRFGGIINNGKIWTQPFRKN